MGAADPRVPSIIDSDAHVIESPATWDHMDEAERKYLPSVTSQTFGAEADLPRRSHRAWPYLKGMEERWNGQPGTGAIAFC